MKHLSSKGELAVKCLVVILMSALLIVPPYLYCFGYLTPVHLLQEAEPNQIKVACVGDSITYGYGIQNWADNNYPACLGRFLGKEYCVNNYGFSGATVGQDTSSPYVVRNIYKKSKSFSPDIVVLALGINDTQNKNWKGKEKFKSEYISLLQTYLSLPSSPKVIIVSATPFFSANDEIKLRVKYLVNGALREIAEEYNLAYLDMYAVFEGKENLMFDGLHPDNEGARLYASAVYYQVIA